jgi:hypothetical protein
MTESAASFALADATGGLLAGGAFPDNARRLN